MLQESGQQGIKVDVHVNTGKVEGFVNELVNLLNRYGLDGIKICNETTIQINLLDLMEYKVTPTETRDNLRNCLIENIIKEGKSNVSKRNIKTSQNFSM